MKFLKLVFLTFVSALAVVILAKAAKVLLTEAADHLPTSLRSKLLHFHEVQS